MNSDKTENSAPIDITSGLLAEPELPPLLKGRRNLPGASALASAVEGASSHQLGAGDVIWADDPTTASFAVVLEPEVPLNKAIQVLPLTMSAIGDCIGVLTPPQVGVTYHWPDQIRVNDAIAGNIALVSATTDPEEIPDWLVVAITVTVQFGPEAAEPGHDRHRTALVEEGCEGLTNIQFIESCSRHFLTWLNLWQDDGFRPVHQNWLERMAGQDTPISIPRADTGAVTVKGLDEDGGLLFATGSAKTQSVPLLSVVQTTEDVLTKQ